MQKGTVLFFASFLSGKIEPSPFTLLLYIVPLRLNICYLVLITSYLPISSSPHLLIQWVSCPPPTTSSGILNVGWASPTGTP
jgi:hypothetical protein